MKEMTLDTHHQTLPVTGYVTAKSHLKYRDPNIRPTKPFLEQHKEDEDRYEQEGLPSSLPSSRNGGGGGGKFYKRGEDDGYSLSTKLTAASSIFSKEDSLYLKNCSSRASSQSQEQDEQESDEELYSSDCYDFDDQDVYDIFRSEAYADFINGFGLKTSRERDIARKEFLQEQYNILYKNKGKLIGNQSGVPSFIKKPFYSVVGNGRDSHTKLSTPKRSFSKDSRIVNRSSLSVFERMNASCAEKNSEGKKLRAKIQAKIVENEKRRNGELCRVHGKISAEQGARLYHDFLAKKKCQEQELSEKQEKLLLEEEQRQKGMKRISLDKALTFYYLEMMWLIRKERRIAEHADKTGESYNPTMNLNQMLKYYIKLQGHERDAVKTLIGRKSN